MHEFFICPDKGQELRNEDGEIPIQDCLNCSKTRLFRDCHWNHTILKNMVEVSDDRISPTRLAACPRSLALKRRYSYAINPKEAWPKVRGTVFHAGLDQLAEGDREVELSKILQTENGEVTIQGRLDLIDQDLSLITDWKTIAYIRKEHAPPDRHVAQLSIYAWLAEPLYRRIAYGELLYLDMSQTRRYVVELWEAERVELWINSRLPLLLKAYDSNRDLPPILTENDPNHWMCKNCDVRNLCKGLP